MNNLREKLAAAMQHNNPLKLRKFESVTLRFLGEIESSEKSRILTFVSPVYGWRAVLIELFRLYDAYKVRTAYHLAFCLYDKISVKVPQIEFAKAVKAQYFHHNSAIGDTLRDPSESPLDWLIMLDALAGGGVAVNVSMFQCFMFHFAPISGFLRGRGKASQLCITNEGIPSQESPLFLYKKH